VDLAIPNGSAASKPLNALDEIKIIRELRFGLNVRHIYIYKQMVVKYSTAQGNRHGQGKVGGMIVSSPFIKKTKGT